MLLAPKKALAAVGMSMVPELLIFDCDGVLIDSEPASSRVLWQALAASGVSISHAEVHQRFTGYSEADCHRICIDDLGVAEPGPLFAAARANLYEEFSRTLAPMRGIAELIRSLDCRKCVASNSSIERLERSLGLFDLWHAFAPHIFSAEMVARPKPAPDLFLFCAERLGVAPAKCLVVDDSAYGIKGAIDAGMTAIGFVDLADPRPNRRAALLAAGAGAVAEGAEELAVLLGTHGSGVNPFNRQLGAAALPA